MLFTYLINICTMSNFLKLYLFMINGQIPIYKREREKRTRHIVCTFYIGGHLKKIKPIII